MLQLNNYIKQICTIKLEIRSQTQQKNQRSSIKSIFYYKTASRNIKLLASK